MITDEEIDEFVEFNRPTSTISKYIADKKTEGYWYNHDDEEAFSYLLRDLHQPGFISTDIDFVIYSKKYNKIMLLDHKTHNSNLRPGQETIYRILDYALRLLSKETKMKYAGCWMIIFEKRWFDDGEVYFKKMFDDTNEKEIVVDEQHFKQIIKQSF